ncbi:MAG: hypothetical protein MUC96_11750 [Myxococcaceae bacterium]|nr:hypothetical protein [Myxococcaceae bacterium]
MKSVKWLLALTAPWPVVVVALAFLAPGRLACGNATGFTPAMLELVSACDTATTRLGTPLDFHPLRGGFGGNYQSGREAGEGYAHGELVMRGPKAQAAVDYVMQKGLGVWSPSVLRLTFDDGTKLDVKACAASEIQRRGQGALNAALERRCTEGQADQCLVLAQLRGATGDVEGAAKARAQACALGLSTACPDSR